MQACQMRQLTALERELSAFADYSIEEKPT